MSEGKKSQLMLGDSLIIDIAGKTSVRAKVELIDGRFIWVKDVTGDNPELENTEYIIQLRERQINFLFRAFIHGSEFIDGKLLTRIERISEMIDNNRRASYRLEKLFEVGIKRADAYEEIYQALDISDTGMGLISPEPFTEGELIRCRFFIDKKEYLVGARVVNVIARRDDEEKTIFKIGIRFEKIDTNTQKDIRHHIFVQQLERRKMRDRKR